MPLEIKLTSRSEGCYFRTRCGARVKLAGSEIESVAPMALVFFGFQVTESNTELPLWWRPGGVSVTRVKVYSGKTYSYKVSVDDPGNDIISAAGVEAGALRVGLEYDTVGGAARVKPKYWIASPGRGQGWVCEVYSSVRSFSKGVFSINGELVEWWAGQQASDEDRSNFKVCAICLAPFPNLIELPPPLRMNHVERTQRADCRSIEVGKKYQMRNGKKIKLTIGYPDGSCYGWSKSARLAVKYGCHGVCTEWGPGMREMQPGSQSHPGNHAHGPWRDLDIVSEWKDRKKRADLTTDPSMTEISDGISYKVPCLCPQ